MQHISYCNAQYTILYFGHVSVRMLLGSCLFEPTTWIRSDRIHGTKTGYFALRL